MLATQIEEIKNANIFIKFFNLRQLKRLQRKYGLVDSKSINSREESLELESKINDLENKIANEKKCFSSKLEKEINFDNFKSEQERLKDYPLSKNELEQEIRKISQELIGLNIDLESDKLEIEAYLKKHNITDADTFNK